MTRAFTACVILIVTGAGCAGKGDAEPQAAQPVRLDVKPEMSTGWRTTQLPTLSQSTAVREGAAPLVYLVEGGGMIRVHDLTDKRDLSRSFVPARSIVRVDGRRGIIYGEDVAFAGPLPDDHRYVIYVDPTGENVARQGVIQPRPRDAR